jgi:hypothetical protein
MIYCYAIVRHAHRHLHRYIRRVGHGLAIKAAGGAAIVVVCVVVGGAGVALGTANGSTVNYSLPFHTEGDSRLVEVPEPSTALLLILPALWLAYRAT